MILAVAYLRVSGAGQLDGDGFDRQRDTISRYAASHDYELTGEYHEDISGTKNVDERDAFCAMIAELSLSDCRTIIIERADRFARSMEAAVASIALCVKEGVQVIGADTGMSITETDDPMLKAFIRMQFVFAELERGMIEMKLRAARQRARQKNGRCEGRKPYGWYDDETTVLADMLEYSRRNGRGPRQIAEILNDNKIPTRSGGSWNPGTISRILRSRFTAKVLSELEKNSS